MERRASKTAGTAARWSNGQLVLCILTTGLVGTWLGSGFGWMAFDEAVAAPPAIRVSIARGAVYLHRTQCPRQGVTWGLSERGFALLWLPRWERSGLGEFTAGVPLWPFAAALVAWSATAWRARCAGACPRCGYDLQGLLPGKCPECGQTEPVRPT